MTHWSGLLIINGRNDHGQTKLYIKKLHANKLKFISQGTLVPWSQAGTKKSLNNRAPPRRTK
jgi:hypothetical protein